MVFRLEEGVGIHSSAGGRSSRAPMCCLFVLSLPALRSCHPAEVSGMRRQPLALAPVVPVGLHQDGATRTEPHPEALRNHES